MIGRNTLLVIIGASRWPNCAFLEDLPSCKRSADAFEDYMYDPLTINVPQENILKIFNENILPDEISQRISKFIGQKLKESSINDIVFYVIGHGSFFKQRYYVSLYSFDPKSKTATAYYLDLLAENVKQYSNKIRCTVIIDACFSSSALKEFVALSGDSCGEHSLSENFLSQTHQMFADVEHANHGIALLCAAGSEEVALAPQSTDLTTFTGTLLDVLRETGCEGDLSPYLSLQDLCKAIRTRLKVVFGSEYPTPHLHLPNQTDCAEFLEQPMFPNPKYGLLHSTAVSTLPSREFNRTGLIASRSDSGILDEAHDCSSKLTTCKFLQTMYFRRIGDLHLYGQFFDRIIDETIDEKNKKSSIQEIADKLVLASDPAKQDKMKIIMLSGHGGSGKSAIMSVLYRYFLALAQSDNQAPIPMFLDGEFYQKKTYEGENSFRQIRSDLQRHIDRLKCLSRNRTENTDIILLLDGISRRNKFSSDFLKELSVSFNEGMPKYLIFSTLEFSDDELLSLLEIPRTKVDLHRFCLSPQISLETEDDARDFLASHKSLTEGRQDQYTHNPRILLDRLTNLDFKKLDVYLASIVAKKSEESEYSAFSSITEFLEQFCHDELRRFQSQSGEDGNPRLDLASKLAFKTLVNSNIVVSEHIRRRPEWTLVNRHNRIRDFLVARYLIEGIASAKEKKHWIHFLRNKNFYYFDFTEDINLFVKDFLNTKNPRFGERVINAIAFLLEDIPYDARIYLYYLLGRFSDVRFSYRAKQILRKEQARLEEMDDAQYRLGRLVALRTILVSLCYLRDEGAVEECLSFLLDHPLAESINLGFHQIYYGDSPGESDDIEIRAGRLDPQSCLYIAGSSWKRSFDALYERLNRHLEAGEGIIDLDPAFRLRLFTLLSFVRTKLEEGEIDEHLQVAIVQLIKKVEERSILNESDKLQSYCRMIYKDLKRKEYRAVFTILKLYRLKSEQRQGWIDRGLSRVTDMKAGIRIESVADHSYMAYLIGKLLLPPTEIFGQRYDKNAVLDMILVHDIGEAYIGDYNVKALDEERIASIRSTERRKMGIFSLRENYEGIYETGEVFKLWCEFEEKKGPQRFEVTLARDIDRLEILFQLEVYRVHLDTAVYGDFKDSITLDLNTAWAKEIAKDLSSISREVSKSIEDKYADLNAKPLKKSA